MSPSRAFRVAATSARVLTGVVVAAACVAGVVVAVPLQWPTVTHEAAQADVTPLPGDTVLVCNGDFRAIGRNTADSLQMVPAASPRLTVEGSSEAPQSSLLSVEDLEGSGGVQRLTGAVEGRTAPLIGATESVTLAEADLSGFAAAPCRPASTESWLVGGTVETGAEDLIVLTNPGAVPSTVSLVSYGSVRGATSVIVPAESQVALPLTSLASGSDLPVVHVTATGSPVRAVLQSSQTRTLDPVGVDLQDSVAAPQQHPVFPGIEVFESDGDNSRMAVLRLLSPERDAQATVTVRAVGESAVVTEFTVALTAEQPLEMSLSDLPPGQYTVAVDADEPVLTGVRIQDGAGPQSDFAWVMPAPEFDDSLLVAVPEGPAATLIVVNDEESDAVVQLETPGGGDPVEITVPARSSASVDIDGDTVYSVNTSGPVHAEVAMIAPGALAAWPVWPTAGAQQSITVYP